MSTELLLNDNKVVAKWKGKKNQGSMFQLSAEQNAKHVNILSAKEIVAVYVCVKFCPFAMGQENKMYQAVVHKIKNGIFAEAVKNAESKPLGDLRKQLVIDCGEGCNAPHDTYLKVAADLHDELFPPAKPAPENPLLTPPVTSNENPQTTSNDQGETRGTGLR